MAMEGGKKGSGWYMGSLGGNRNVAELDAGGV